MIWTAVAPLYDALAGESEHLRRENRALRSAGHFLAGVVAARDAELARLRPRAAMVDEALGALDEVYGQVRDAAGRLGLRGKGR